MKTQLFLFLYLSIAPLLSCNQLLARTWQNTPDININEDSGQYIVIDHKAIYAVIVSESATPTEKLAAEEYKNTIKKISGADVGIQNKPANNKQRCIILGTAKSNYKIKEALTKISNGYSNIEGSDGFCIIKNGNTIYVIGDQPKGVLNGVYDFLEKNTGIIWTRSTEMGDVFTEMQSIKIVKTDYCEKSPFDLRGWHSCGFGDEGNSDPKTQLLLSRSKINLDMVEFGNVKEPFTHSLHGVHGLLAGHNLNKWLPNEKYFAEHPEYYCLVDGKRVPVGPNTGQVNFAHPGVANVIANNVIDYLKTAPESMDYIGITAEDNSIFDQSELSTRPFKTEAGTMVSPSDPAYKSTVFFTFLNKVTQLVRVKYPNTRIVTFAYLFTDEPPVCELDKNIHIIFAPLSECDRHPFNSDEKTCLSNSRYNQKLVNWVKKTNNLIIYNYYGSFDSYEFERPIEEKVQADLLYYRKLGIKGILPEGSADLVRDQQAGWAVNAMRFWIMNRLFWNPDLDIGALKEEYLLKTFGSAAQAMRKYSGLVEEGWNYDGSHIGWQVSGLSMFSQYIVNSGLAGNCLNYLDEALSVADSASKPRIDEIKNVFTDNMAKVANMGIKSAKVPRTKSSKDDIMNSSDFTLGPWATSTLIADFRVAGNTKILAPTKVYLMWDDANIYVGYDNKDTNVAKTVASDSVADNWWDNDDDVETFITGDMDGNEKYYALMSNAMSLKLDYSGPDRDPSFNPEWECRSILKSDGWSTIQVIPFRSIGVNINAVRQLKVNFFRTYHINGEGSYCSWLGGSVWNYLDMKLLQLTD